MRKFILSGLVVLSFIMYSLQQRQEGSGPVIAPAALGQKSSQSSPAAQATQSTSTPSPTPTTSQPANAYKDGSYVGLAGDAYYGNIQVQVTIQNGKLTDVKFLQYPHDQPNSVMINRQAMPYLQQEAIQAQSAHVNIISGATDTSIAFVESLSSALAKAH